MKNLATPSIADFSYLLKNLESSMLVVAQKAAIASYKWVGKGDEEAADRAAVGAMRVAFNEMHITGKIAIGEGERDRAPMLFIGERVGIGDTEIDIALDPLEGTTLCANNSPNSIAVVAMAGKDCFLHAPDVYMQKIVVGPNIPKDTVSIDYSVADNINNLANAKNKDVADIVVCILNRPRHQKLIEEVRAVGARIKLITDGDIVAAIATCMPSMYVDMYMGIGGAPEGVLAAAGIKAMGGRIEGRLVFDNDIEKTRAKCMGLKDPDATLFIDDMVKGDSIFFAAGVTDGEMLKGVKKGNFGYIVNSMIISSVDKKISFNTCEFLSDE